MFQEAEDDIRDLERHSTSFNKLLENLHISWRDLNGSSRMVVVMSFSTVRDTSSNDTSSTTTLRRKFLSNYQFVEK